MKPHTMKIISAQPSINRNAFHKLPETTLPVFARLCFMELFHFDATGADEDTTAGDFVFLSEPAAEVTDRFRSGMPDAKSENVLKGISGHNSGCFWSEVILSSAQRRKPILRNLESGEFLSRFVASQFLAELFQPPPQLTRPSPSAVCVHSHTLPCMS